MDEERTKLVAAVRAYLDVFKAKTEEAAKPSEGAFNAYVANARLELELLLKEAEWEAWAARTPQKLFDLIPHLRAIPADSIETPERLSWGRFGSGLWLTQQHGVLIIDEVPGPRPELVTGCEWRGVPSEQIERAISEKTIDSMEVDAERFRRWLRPAARPAKRAISRALNAVVNLNLVQYYAGYAHEITGGPVRLETAFHNGAIYDLCMLRILGRGWRVAIMPLRTDSLDEDETYAPNLEDA